MPRKPKKAAGSEGEKYVLRELKRRKDCPDCGSDSVVFDSDTERLICQDCGSIFEEIVEL